jgi:hypothetical protein
MNNGTASIFNLRLPYIPLTIVKGINAEAAALRLTLNECGVAWQHLRLIGSM